MVFVPPPPRQGNSPCGLAAPGSLEVPRYATARNERTFIDYVRSTHGEKADKAYRKIRETKTREIPAGETRLCCIHFIDRPKEAADADLGNGSFENLAGVLEQGRTTGLFLHEKNDAGIPKTSRGAKTGDGKTHRVGGDIYATILLAGTAGAGRR